MKQLLNIGTLAISLIVLVVSGFSQSDPDLIEAKIIFTPSVAIPVEAKSSGLGGRVGVLVKIDDTGNMTGVERVSGAGSVCPSVDRADVVALRETARQAALQMKFQPATRKDKAVESALWVSFNFPERNDGDEKNYTAAPPVGDATPVGTPKLITGGVVNGKAQRLPSPSYPPAAKAIRASGTVSVQVLIDESGDIFSAEAVAGHPLLRAAARQAACEAKFSPTKLEGHPVKVSGIITYNFVNP